TVSFVATACSAAAGLSAGHEVVGARGVDQVEEDTADRAGEDSEPTRVRGDARRGCVQRQRPGGAADGRARGAWDARAGAAACVSGAGRASVRLSTTVFTR